MGNSDPSGTDYVDTAYNGLGQIQSVSNPHRSGSNSTDGTTSFAYDALGRKITQMQPDGTTLQWCYDGIATSGIANCPGNASSVPGIWVDSYDEVGNHRQHVFDALGRLLAVVEPNASNNLAAETDYAFDALNNLSRVDQYAGKPGSADAVRGFSYDLLGRLLSAYNPETGTVSYAYDANGNLSTKTDARGVVIRHCYDTLNRLLSKSSPDKGCPAPAPYATWAYDQTSAQVGSGTVQIPNGIGRLTSERSASTVGSYCDAYTYDAMGRVIRNFFTWFCSGSGAYFIKTAGYDLAGNQTYYENGDWRAFNYNYNGAGEITAVTTGPTYQPADATLVSGIGYDPTGGAGTINLGNGAQEQISRDNRLRVWMDNLMPSLTATNAIYGWNAAFDTAGNLRHVNDWYVMGNWDYTYDPLNRLATSVASLPYAGWGGATGAQTSSTGCQYAYDTFGNRTYMGPYGNGKQCTTLSLNFGGNRIATTGVAGYDAAGDVTADATGGNSIGYDAEGRVATVSGPGGNASYLYDPEGQRVAANVNGTNKYFAHDLAGHLAWTNYLSGGPEEVWLNGRHFGSVYANPDLSLNHVVYSMVDAVGTERAQFDSNQHLVASFTSNPFGDNQQTTAGGNSDTVHFTGKERDAESGLDYFGARYYASSMGRWMSPDWSAKQDPVPYAKLDNPQSLNLYGYVGNNPLSMADPDGHEGCCDVLPSKAEVDAALAGIAAASSGGGGTLAGAARFIPWLAGPAIIGGAMAHPITVGQSDADEIAQRDANIKQNQEHQEAAPEPQVSTSGAGARQGGGKMTDHGQQRADEAKSDAHRQVGDANRVVREGRSFTDTETGAMVHVNGNRVVITGQNGQVTRFKNTRAQTQGNIQSGKWQPN